MTNQPVNTIYYKLHLLANIGDEPTGGTLVIDTYTFDPKLTKGDSIHIENWKVGVDKDNGRDNETFSFDATVIDIQKTVIRHEGFIVNLILESPDRDTITKLKKAFRDRNPEQFSS
jgi:hypothetical protein